MTKNSKSMKKFLATATATTIVAGVVAPMAFAANLTDIDGHRHEEAINALVEKGIISGYEDNSFQPNKVITRAEGAIMIARALGLLDGKDIPENTFSDVGENSKAYEAIVKLADLNIVSGFGNGIFAPEKEITRGQMAKYIANAYELELGDGKTAFPDVAENAQLAKYVDAIADAGIAGGYENGNFGYNDALKRGDFAKMVYNAENLETATAAVDSIIALNPTMIQVKFNKAIDKETINKSVSINNAVIDGGALYELSEDGKTLNVRVAKLDVDKAYAVKVEGIETVDGVKVPTAVETILFADEEAATIDSVTAKAGATGKTKIVKVVFSEDIATSTTAANFRVNNVSPTNATIVNNVATLELPADIETGKTHELRIIDVADLTGNKTTVTEEFTVESDTTAPVAAVTATDENTIKVEFDEAVNADNLTVKILKGNINVTGTQGTLSADRKSIEFAVNPLVYGENETSADLTVEVSGVKDLYENAAAKSTHSVTVTKDVTAPTITKMEGTVGENTFVISFSEELAGTAGAAIQAPTVFKDNVKLAVSSAVLQADNNGKLNQILVTTGTNLEAGNYEVTLAEGIVTDDSLALNKNAQVKKTFTATSPTAENDTVKPGVSTVAVNGDVVTVTYSEDVTSSAVDYKNYKLDGVTIPADSGLYFENNKRTVKIELPAGYFTADKNDATVEITNVSDIAGNVMNKFTKLNQAVTDTKAPEIVAAKLIANNKIELEFNEDMDTTVSNFNAAKVVVKDAAGDAVANIMTDATASVDGKKVTLTLATGKTLDTTKAYTVSAEAGIGLVDQAATNDDGTGNEVKPFTNKELVEGVVPVLTDSDIFADDLFTTNVTGITAKAISTTAIAKAHLDDAKTVKLVYSDADTTTADVVVTGTFEMNAAQDEYTYSFGSADLSGLKAGAVTVNLVLVDENGNESAAHNVVVDGSNGQFTNLNLVK